MKELNKIDVKYLAGFFDGEGHVGIYNNYKKSNVDFFRLRIVIVNSNFNIIRRIRRQFGGYIYKRKKIGKPVYNLSWSDAQVVPFLKVIYPHLILKRHHAELAFEFRSTYSGGRIDKKINVKSMMRKRKRIAYQVMKINRGVRKRRTGIIGPFWKLSKD